MKRLLILDFALLIAFFLAWCILDYVLVRSPAYPANIHSADWAFMLVPIGTLGSNLWITRHLPRPASIFFSILGTVVLTIALVFAVTTLGISFHFSLGGQL